jgi:hypothetical protein
MSDPQRPEREAIEQALRQVWTILGNATLPASDVVRRAFKIADTALLALPVSVEPRDGTKGDCIYCMKPGHVYRHSGGYNWSMCDACRDSSAALPPTPTPGWQPMDSAPKDRRILAVVDGIVRVVRHGKTSHVPLYGFCLADQGVEDFDLCDPTGWQDLPPAPTGERE